MSDDRDIRWLQRYDNFHRACSRLNSVTDTHGLSALTELEQEGLIQRFEYTFELAWKTMQDLLEYKGYDFVKGPNGTIRMALEDRLVTDHDGWRRMARARTMSSHTYDEEEVKTIVEDIFGVYAALLSQLDATLAEERKRLLGTE